MSDSAALIDWEQLEMIFGEDDKDFDEDMAELFQEFVEDGAERFGILKAASFEAEKDMLGNESHKLKGSSSNFGFSREASELANIEDNIESLSFEAFQASLLEAERAFLASAAEVKNKYSALQN